MNIKQEETSSEEDNFEETEELIEDVELELPDLENADNLSISCSEDIESNKEEIELEETFISVDNIKEENSSLINNEEQLEDNEDNNNMIGKYFPVDVKPNVDFGDDIKIEETVFLDENKLQAEEIKCECKEEFPLPEKRKRRRLRDKKNINNKNEDGVFDSDEICTKENRINNSPINVTKTLRTIDDSTEKFQCQFCDYAPIDRLKLRDHIDVVHFGLTEYNWKGRQNDLDLDLDVTKRDARTAKQRETTYYKCVNCDYRTRYSWNVTKHLRVVHLKLKQYNCLQCDYRTDYSANLKRHTDGVHLKLRNFKCSQCRYAFSQSSCLSKHITAAHDRTKEYFNCRFCVFRSSSMSALKRHVKRVHDYKCSYCDYRSNRLCKLNVHVNVVHRKHHNCGSCDYCRSQPKRSSCN